jgi:hypothetical protein
MNCALNLVSAGWLNCRSANDIGTVPVRWHRARGPELDEGDH